MIYKAKTGDSAKGGTLNDPFLVKTFYVIK